MAQKSIFFDIAKVFSHSVDPSRSFKGKDYVFSKNIDLFLFHPADPPGITDRVDHHEFQPSYDIYRRSGAKGFVRPQVPCKHPQPTLPNC